MSFIEENAILRLFYVLEKLNTFTTRNAKFIRID